ncbi:MAG: alkaline phosphatase [Terrimicrobiaceae bacterium]
MKTIRFAKLGLAAALLGSLLSAPSAQAQSAKNVILMISDGAGFNTFRATDLYTGITPVYEGADFVKYGMQTYSASRPVAYDSSLMFNGTDAMFAMTNFTDSASAATAMYTGVKNYDGEVNWTTDDKPLTTYFEQAASVKDRSIGAVSSVEFSHATPAAVYGHNSSRNNYAAIGSEGVYGSNPLDGSTANNSNDPAAGNNALYDSLNYNGNLKVLMGAGSGDYDDNGTGNTAKTDQYVGGSATWTDIKDGAPNDWTVVQTKTEFEAVANGTVASAPDKLLGVAQVNTTLQQSRTNPAGDFDPLNTNVPTLETMTKAALNVLAKNENGFAVMIEGGAVDWAGHANQSDRNIEEHIDFNLSVQAVVDFVNLGGDNIDWTNTLLIVTADHETGNLWGSGSYTDVNSNGKYDAGTDTFNGYQSINGSGDAVLTDMQWLSGEHTNALVPLYAKGAGSELFASFVVGTEDINAYYGTATSGFSDGQIGYIDNTSVHTVMSNASAVPEPSTYALMGLGAVLVVWTIRRKNRTA